MGISKENVCFNLEVETATDLYKSSYFHKSNGACVPRVHDPVHDANKIKST